jgi:outer membrane protein TolC
MKSIVLLCALALPALARAQSSPMALDSLVREVYRGNPEILAARSRAEMLDAKVRQAGSLDDLQFTYMREEMPGFRWDGAMMQKFELMQMVRFPSKLRDESTIAAFDALREHLAHDESVNGIVQRIKVAYVELWMTQEKMRLNAETWQLLSQVVALVRARHSAGAASLQDVLKASIERTLNENDRVTLRQEELSAKAMLMSLLARSPADTLGVAVLPESAPFTISLDTLELIALRGRPLVLRDSLARDQGGAAVSLAEREYLPDFRFSVQYVTAPAGDFRGWSVGAGLTLPFAPWTLGKASGRVEEAEATKRESQFEYDAVRNMVRAEVRDLYYRVQAARLQLDRYREEILPQARQALQAGVASYQSGGGDLLMLIDTYRTEVGIASEALMARVRFEQSLAGLERAVGRMNIAQLSNTKEK